MIRNFFKKNADVERVYFTVVHYQAFGLFVVIFPLAQLALHPMNFITMIFLGVNILVLFSAIVVINEKSSNYIKCFLRIFIISSKSTLGWIGLSLASWIGFYYLALYSIYISVEQYRIYFLDILYHGAIYFIFRSKKINLFNQKFNEDKEIKFPYMVRDWRLWVRVFVALNLIRVITVLMTQLIYPSVNESKISIFEFPVLFISLTIISGYIMWIANIHKEIPLISGSSSAAGA